MRNSKQCQMDQLRRSPRKKQIQEPDKGRRKLDFNKDDKKKPFRGWKVFLNLQTKSDAIRERIQDLGGIIEDFLSKDINLVITSQKQLPKTELFGALPSPTSSVPSPMFSNKQSITPFSADSPQNSIENIKRQRPQTTTRGKSLLDKALITKNGSGSANAVTKAKRFGAVILTIEEFSKKYMRRKSAQVADISSLKTKKNVSTSRGSHVRTLSDIKVTNLQEPFFKIEDQSKLFRPIVHELKSWPKIYTDTYSTQSPFDIPKEVKSERGKTYDAEMDEETISIEERSFSEEKIKANTSSKHAKSARKSVTKTAGLSKQGYCDCCSVRYQDLTKHLKGDQHRSYAKNDSKFHNLDKIINSCTRFTKYLKELQKTLLEEKKTSDSQKPSAIEDEVIVKQVNASVTVHDVFRSPEKQTSAMYIAINMSPTYNKLQNDDKSQTITQRKTPNKLQNLGKSPCGAYKVITPTRRQIKVTDSCSPVSPCRVVIEKTIVTERLSSFNDEENLTNKKLLKNSFDDQSGNRIHPPVKKNHVCSEKYACGVLQYSPISLCRRNREDSEQASSVADVDMQQLLEEGRISTLKEAAYTKTSTATDREQIADVTRQKIDQLNSTPQSGNNLSIKCGSVSESSPICRQVRRRRRKGAYKSSSEVHTPFENARRATAKENLNNDSFVNVSLDFDHDCLISPHRLAKVPSKVNSCNIPNIVAEGMKITSNNDDDDDSEICINYDLIDTNRGKKNENFQEVKQSIELSWNHDKECAMEDSHLEETNSRIVYHLQSVPLAVKSEQQSMTGNYIEHDTHSQKATFNYDDSWIENLPLGDRLAMIQKLNESISKDLNKNETKDHEADHETIITAVASEDLNKNKTRDLEADHEMKTTACSVKGNDNDGNSSVSSIPGGNLFVTPNPEMLFHDIFLADGNDGRCFEGYLPNGEETFCNPETCSAESHKKSVKEMKDIQSKKVLEFSDEEDRRDDEYAGINDVITATIDGKTNESLENVDSLSLLLLQGSTPKRKNKRESLRKQVNHTSPRRQKMYECLDEDISVGGVVKEEGSLDVHRKRLSNVKKRPVTPLENERCRKRSRTSSKSDSKPKDDRKADLFAEKLMATFSEALYDRIKESRRLAAKLATKSINPNSSAALRKGRVRSKSQVPTTSDCQPSSLRTQTSVEDRIIETNFPTSQSLQTYFSQHSPRAEVNSFTRRVSPRKHKTTSKNELQAYKNISKRSRTLKFGDKSSKKKSCYTNTPFHNPQSKDEILPDNLKDSFEFDENLPTNDTTRTRKKHRTSKTSDNEHDGSSNNLKIRSKDDVFEFP